MDRIFEAYNGNMGAEFMHKTRERLHWICSQVWGSRVLDVGCSQGVVPVVLARMGYAVDGIDINPEAIAFANEQLAKEPADVQSKVTYTVGDFGKFVLPKDRKYDVITMSEVLEHLVRPLDFVRKAFTVLPEKGRFIVTVPFGINDDPDHRQTFYLTSIYSLLHPLFEVSAVKIFNGWIGLIGRRRAEETREPPVIPLNLMRQAEEAFFKIERPLRDGTLAVRNQRLELKAQQEKLAGDLRAAEQARLEAEARVAAAEATPLRAELADVRGQLSASEGEKQSLQTSLEVERKASSGLQDQVAMLKAMLQFITNQQKSDSSVAVQEQRLLAYSQETRELRDANGELKTQLAVSNLERTHLSERLAQVEATVSAAERKAAEAVKTIERYEAENSALRDGAAALRETIQSLGAEKAALGEALEGEKTWAAQHKAEFDAYQADSERRNSVLVAENADARKEIADLKARLGVAEGVADKELSLHKKFSAEAYKANQQVAALTERIEALEKEQASVGERYAAEKKAHHRFSAEAYALQRQVAAMKGEMARLQKVKQALERKYEKLAKSKLGRLTLRYWAFKDGKRSKRADADAKKTASGDHVPVVSVSDDVAWTKQRENEERFFRKG